MLPSFSDLKYRASRKWIEDEILRLLVRYSLCEVIDYSSQSLGPLRLLRVANQDTL